MSTIQTQISLVHLDSGIPVTSVVQRESNESTFVANAITVGTTDETIPLGDVITAEQVEIKLTSGDRLRIGLDGSYYPFTLVRAGEGQILRLDVEGLVETQSITTVADVADSLDGTYFAITDVNGETWAIGVGTLTHSEDHEVATALLTGQTAIQVAAALYAALAADTGFLAVFAATNPDGATILTITDKHTGTRANIADTGSTGFTLATTQSGAASPVIHLKSTGTSQVVVGVAPH